MLAVFVCKSIATFVVLLLNNGITSQTEMSSQFYLPGNLITGIFAVRTIKQQSSDLLEMLILLELELKENSKMPLVALFLLAMKKSFGKR